MNDKSLLGTAHKYTPKDFAENKHPEEIMVIVCDYLNILRKRYQKYLDSGEDKKRRGTLQRAVVLLNYLDINFRPGFKAD